MKTTSFGFNALYIKVGKGLYRVYDIRDITKESGGFDDLQSRIVDKLTETNIEEIGQDEKVSVEVSATAYVTVLHLPIPLPVAGFDGIAQALDDSPMPNRAEAAAAIVVAAVVNMLDKMLDLEE